MKYIHAALILHHSNLPVTEESITATLKGAGTDADSVIVKATVESLKGVDVADLLLKAEQPRAVPTVISTPVMEEKPKEQEKTEDPGAGLSQLFGE